MYDHRGDFIVNRELHGTNLVKVGSLFWLKIDVSVDYVQMIAQGRRPYVFHGS